MNDSIIENYLGLSSITFEPPKCKYCGVPKNANVWFCCDKSREESYKERDKEYISWLQGRGYKVIRKNKSPECPNCDCANKIVMYDADLDLCQNCGWTFPPSGG